MSTTHTEKFAIVKAALDLKQIAQNNPNATAGAAAGAGLGALSGLLSKKDNEDDSQLKHSLLMALRNGALGAGAGGIAGAGLDQISGDIANAADQGTDERRMYFKADTAHRQALDSGNKIDRIRNKHRSPSQDAGAVIREGGRLEGLIKELNEDPDMLKLRDLADKKAT